MKHTNSFGNLFFREYNEELHRVINLWNVYGTCGIICARSGSKRLNNIVVYERLYNDSLQRLSERST